MPLPVAEIERILTTGGELTFLRANAPQRWYRRWKKATPMRTSRSQTLKSFDREPQIDGNYYRCKTTISGNSITLTSVAEQNPTADAINVVYDGDTATVGAMYAPCYIYSGSFSGCVFFLFRGQMYEVHGVHASRQSGQLRDPSEAFRNAGCTLLYRWDSMGLMGIGTFGSVLCCVDQGVIDVFALQQQGRTVQRVIEHVTIDDWRGTPHVAL